MKAHLTLSLISLMVVFSAKIFAVDCGAVPAAYRAQCESALKAKDACEGKSGDEYKKCVTGNIDFKAVANCDKEATKMKKTACEFRMQTQEACKGKMGAELKACVTAQAKNIKGGY